MKRKIKHAGIGGVTHAEMVTIADLDMKLSGVDTNRAAVTLETADLNMEMNKHTQSLIGMEPH